MFFFFFLACVCLFVCAPSPCSGAEFIPPCCSLSFLCWIKVEGKRSITDLGIFPYYMFSFFLCCYVFCLFHAIFCILFMQMHIQTLRGRILETILSLRFFLFQYGIVYKLHLTGKDTSLAVHFMSFFFCHFAYCEYFNVHALSFNLFCVLGRT